MLLAMKMSGASRTPSLVLALLALALLALALCPPLLLAWPNDAALVQQRAAIHALPA